MLYWLLYLKLFHYFPPFRIFRYLTFRTAFASLTALFTGLIIGPLVINRLRDATKDVQGMALFMQAVQDVQIESRVSRTQLDQGNLVRADETILTTIVAMDYADGVIMAGDRRSTAGNVTR